MDDDWIEKHVRKVVKSRNKGVEIISSLQSLYLKKSGFSSGVTGEEWATGSENPLNR